MFEEGPIDGVVVKPLECFRDDRGWLIELYREDDLLSDSRPCMAYISETLPGVVRGPHEHREQSDLFAFVGPGDFKLYLWDTRETSATYGHRQSMIVGESNRVTVLVPPGVIHAYKAVSDSPGWAINLPNALYAGEGKRGPVDEIRHEDIEDSPYVLD